MITIIERIMLLVFVGLLLLCLTTYVADQLTLPLPECTDEQFNQ